MTTNTHIATAVFYLKSNVTFTGKERDEETGYSYFGARYYDPEISGLFLSVDPMADKYPSVSPYAYCAWNPVKLIDYDGRMHESIDKWPPPYLKKWKILSRKEKSFILWDWRFYKLCKLEENAKVASSEAKKDIQMMLEKVINVMRLDMPCGKH